MAQNKLLNVAPVLLTTTLTTNILNCNVTSLAGPVGFSLSQPYLIIRKLRAVNAAGAAATVTLYKGATGANASGTEVCKGKSVAANDFVDIEVGSGLRMDSTDFLVGGSNTASAITLLIQAEIGISG